MQQSLFDKRLNIVPPSRHRDRAAKPLFIWAGGKSKMFKHYVDILPHGDTFDTYIEPFFGGGAMLLDTIHYMKKYYNSKLKRIVINDINEGIVNIYKTIREDVVGFIGIMDQLSAAYLPLDYDGRRQYYFDLREEHAFDYQKWNSTEEAASLYFLMKTGFNGIWQVNKNTGGRFGTPNGLLNEVGFVYEKHVVLYWNGILQDADIHCSDWKECCDQYDLEKSFIFLDPPYRGCFTSYGEDFGDAKQIELIDFCKEIPESSNIFLCNRDIGDNFFEDRLGNLNIKHIEVTYTAGRRKKTDDGFEAKKAKEVLLYN